MEASCFCAPGLMLGGDDEKELKPSPSPNDLSTFANSSTASSINSMAKAVDGSPSEEYIHTELLSLAGQIRIVSIEDSIGNFTYSWN